MFAIVFERIRKIKIVLVVVAVVIALASLLASHCLTRDLQQEERNKMEVWAEAMRSLNAADENTDLNLVLKVINGNNTIPVIVLDKEGNIQTHRNLDLHFSLSEDSAAILRRRAAEMKRDGHSIRIYLDAHENQGGTALENHRTQDRAMDSVKKRPDSFMVIQPVTEQGEDFIEICYDESLLLRRLTVYPYIQLGVVVLFVLIAIFALFTSMKAEQDKVWVGLSKETAHQLGTPISSLMAWTEVLKETHPDDTLLPEMEKDVRRLELIAERFSKIGSIPEPKPVDVGQLVERVAEYMDHRTSHKVSVITRLPSTPIVVNMVAPLFEWVLENLCKNAIDAMSGNGQIDVVLSENSDFVVFEIRDTGKGIPKSHFNSVFKPGFTTKERGWGLGLSLAKRIVENYHRGRIFVKSSEQDKGTTFRIELPKGA